MEDFSVETERIGDTIIIEPVGEQAFLAAPTLRDVFAGGLRTDGVQRVILSDRRSQ